MSHICERLGCDIRITYISSHLTTGSCDSCQHRTEGQIMKGCIPNTQAGKTTEQVHVHLLMTFLMEKNPTIINFVCYTICRAFNLQECDRGSGVTCL